MKILKSLIATALLGASVAWAELPSVTLYKDPNCGCCSKWAERMRDAGFHVKEVHSQQMAQVKQQLGVPEALGSCHTALVGGYLVEGHVPVADVKRLLESGTDVAGVAVPGMPAGSPGMEGPYPAEHYDVLSFERSGKAAVFARH